MTTEFTTVCLKDLIQSRRTCYQFADADAFPVSDPILYECIEAARWAPNHKLTQPWRFWIVGEQAKQVMADIYADHRALKKVQKDDDQYPSLYSKAFEKFMAIPKVVLVGQVLSQNPTIRKEDYAACACAIQNFQLMAWSLQVGVQWSTGPIISDVRTYQYLSINPNQIELIGALYLGHLKADCQNLSSKREPLEHFIIHID